MNPEAFLAVTGAPKEASCIASLQGGNLELDSATSSSPPHTGAMSLFFGFESEGDGGPFPGLGLALVRRKMGRFVLAMSLRGVPWWRTLPYVQYENVRRWKGFVMGLVDKKINNRSHEQQQKGHTWPNFQHIFHFIYRYEYHNKNLLGICVHYLSILPSVTSSHKSHTANQASQKLTVQKLRIPQNSGLLPTRR